MTDKRILLAEVEIEDSFLGTSSSDYNTYLCYEFQVDNIIYLKSLADRGRHKNTRQLNWLNACSSLAVLEKPVDIQLVKFSTFTVFTGTRHWTVLTKKNLANVITHIFFETILILFSHQTPSLQAASSLQIF
jgi:hypothetical protein